MQEYIVIIDDEQSITDSIRDILESLGLSCCTFNNADDYLESDLVKYTACLIADIRMPFKTGLELYNELQQINRDIPTIFITGFNEIKLITGAMKAGAVDVLEKPFHEYELIDVVNLALRRRKQLLKRRSKQKKVCEQAQYLTKREFEVFKLLIEGKFNKMIASELHLSPRTVERHRYNLMKKMQVKSLPDLVYCAQELKQSGQMF